MSVRHRTRLLALCAAAVLGSASAPLLAVNRFWNNPAGGTFSTATNWSGGIVPGTADTALFDISGATYTVTLSAGVTNNQLVVGRDHVTLNRNSHDYILTSAAVLPATPSFAVGELFSDNATLDLIGAGELRADDGVIAKAAGSVGNVTMAGGALRVDALTVAYSGRGDLLVNSGLLAVNDLIVGSLAGSTGTATVTGPSSISSILRLRVGINGSGAFSILNSANVTASRAEVAASGTLNLSGANSRLFGDFLDAGVLGGGLLTIASGGAATIASRVQVYDTAVANVNAGGILRTPELNLINGTLNVASTGNISIDTPATSSTTGAGFSVGILHDGRLYAEQNASLTNNRNAFIGEQAGSSGLATVTSGANWTNTGFIDIGSRGSGALNVTNGGRVSASEIYIAPFPTANGNAFVGSGASLPTAQLSAASNIFVGGLSTTPGGVATLDVSNGSVIAGSLIRLHPSATVNFDGGLINADTLDIRGGAFHHYGGTLDVTTAGSSTVIGVIVGDTGNGTMTISSGGHLDSVNVGHIGFLPGSTGVVNVQDPASIWSQTGGMTVGRSGTGTLTISAGGQVITSDVLSLGNAIGGNGTVNLTGPNSRLNVGTDLIVAQSTGTTGVLTVASGAVLTNRDARIALGTSASGNAYVHGTASTWNSSGNMVIGGSSAPLAMGHLQVGVLAPGGEVTANTITIATGGRITQNSGAIKTPTLTMFGGLIDQNAGQLIVGFGATPATEGTFVGTGPATGTLNVNFGGRLNSGASIIAADPASIGNVTVDGGRWDTSFFLDVGSRGKGTLTVQNAGQLNTLGSAYIGAGAGAIGAATVNDADWSATGHLAVGFDGVGSLAVINAALVTADRISVPYNPGAEGSAKITGGSAQLRANTMDISLRGGPGLVAATDTGFVNITGPLAIHTNGRLEMYGGNVAANPLQLVGGTFSGYGNFTSNVNTDIGTIDVPASQALYLSGNLVTNLGASAALQKTGEGILIVNGPQTHHPAAGFNAVGGQTIFNTNAGTPATAATAAFANLWLTVGFQPAYVALNSDQDLAELYVDSAAAGRQSLNLFSPATAGGYRALRIYGNAITRSELWAMITRANRAGAPDPLDGIWDSSLSSHPNSGIGLAKKIDAHGDIYLLIRPARIGDLNLDGSVTISDFIDLSSNFGASGPNITWQEGDLNYDNAVTISDFIDFAANYGASYAGASAPISTSAVPEPLTFLSLFPLAFLFRRARSPRHS